MPLRLGHPRRFFCALSLALDGATAMAQKKANIETLMISSNAFVFEFGVWSDL
jgi:hypothetical protein